MITRAARAAAPPASAPAPGAAGVVVERLEVRVDEAEELARSAPVDAVPAAPVAERADLGRHLDSASSCRRASGHAQALASAHEHRVAHRQPDVVAEAGRRLDVGLGSAPWRSVAGRQPARAQRWRGSRRPSLVAGVAAPSLTPSVRAATGPPPAARSRPASFCLISRAAASRGPGSRSPGPAATAASSSARSPRATARGSAARCCPEVDVARHHGELRARLRPPRAGRRRAGGERERSSRRLGIARA